MSSASRPSANVVKPTRSANRTETRRRSATGAAAPGPGGVVRPRVVAGRNRRRTSRPVGWRRRRTGRGVERSGAFRTELASHRSRCRSSSRSPIAAPTRGWGHESNGCSGESEDWAAAIRGVRPVPSAYMTYSMFAGCSKESGVGSRLKRIMLPSGDQDGLMAYRPRGSRYSSVKSVPSGLTSHSEPFCRPEPKKRMRVPSGDQRNVQHMTSVPSGVICWAPLPSRSRTKSWTGSGRWRKGCGSRPGEKSPGTSQAVVIRCRPLPSCASMR